MKINIVLSWSVFHHSHQDPSYAPPHVSMDHMHIMHQKNPMHQIKTMSTVEMNAED